MDNLVCANCGTTYYSAAAPTMVERGETCDCGGRLRRVGDEAEVPVGGAPAEAPANGPAAPRRFTRE